jgi:Flp pilus assembly pilin Flp
MGFVTRNYVRLMRSRGHFDKGQTMTEYALILAAIAIVVFVAYKTMGNSITTMVQNISGQLTSAS